MIIREQKVQGNKKYYPQILIFMPHDTIKLQKENNNIKDYV